MAGDNVKLKIDGDPSGLIAAVEKAIKNIEEQSKKIKLSPTMTSKAAAVAPGVKEYQQAHAKVQQARNDQVAAEASNRLLIQKENLLAKIARQESELVKSGKDASFWANERLKTEKAITEEKKASAILSDRTNKEEIRSYKELFSAMEKGFKTSGMGGIKGVWGGMNNAEKVGFGATSIGGILSAIGGVANYVGQRPIDIARMQSSAINMMTGRQLGEARTGEYTYQGMYGEERQKAQEQATSSNRWKTVGDIALAGASVLGLLAVGGSALATGGLSLGGLVAGGLSLGGLKSAFVDKGIADPAKYAAYRSQRTAQDFTTLLAAAQDSSPYRKDAIERLKATGARDLNMERVLGIKDFKFKDRTGEGFGGYYGGGGYLKSQMALGFTDEMVTKASQDILGAGGSTAMALKSGTALQAERGLGLTNASQLLGQLSGVQSIPETSKKTLVDIFARGFDASKYAEENRKYMQAVTEQVYKGGSTSEASASRIADLMHAAIGDTPTTRKIEAAQNAFEAFQTGSSALTGYLGGINITSAMQDRFLKNVRDPGAFRAFAGMKFNEIDENDPYFRSSVLKYGGPLSPEFVANDLRERSITNAKNSIQNKTGMEAVGRVQGLFPGLDQRSAESYINLINQPQSAERDAQIAKLTAEANKKMNDLQTGKAGDTAVQASVKNAAISLETLSQSIDKFADDAMRAANKLSGESRGGRAHEASVLEAQTAYEAARTLPPVWNPKTHAMEFPGDIAGRNLSTVQNQGN